MSKAWLITGSSRGLGRAFTVAGAAEKSALEKLASDQQWKPLSVSTDYSA
jgi:NAD(P)-dependent dehydrogenase (short-subunit alcohol dehydrogenase family)